MTDKIALLKVKTWSYCLQPISGFFVSLSVKSENLYIGLWVLVLPVAHRLPLNSSNPVNFICHPVILSPLPGCYSPSSFPLTRPNSFFDFNIVNISLIFIVWLFMYVSLNNIVYFCLFLNFRWMKSNYINHLMTCVLYSTLYLEDSSIWLWV